MSTTSETNALYFQLIPFAYIFRVFCFNSVSLTTPESLIYS